MTDPYFADEHVTLYQGSAAERLAELEAGSVDCIVTSPPYFGLRDYGADGQIGLEPTPAEYVDALRAVFAEAHRVLADGGTLWLNLGDSYAGKANGGASVGPTSGHGRPDVIPRRHNTTVAAPYKSMLGIPWRVAFALIDDGWTLRNDIIWNKPNAKPENVSDRVSSRHEHVFLLTKGPDYWFDLDPIRELYDGERDASRRSRTGRTNKSNAVATAWAEGDKGRNPGDVWSIPTQPFPGAHFAVMPGKLARRCIAAGCQPGGVVLDPFHGSGTTGAAAAALGHRYVGIELNPEFLDLSLSTRLQQTALLDGEVPA